MAGGRIGGSGLDRALQRQFEEEVREVVLTVTPYGDVEAIMRLRALAEISGILSTSELLELTLKIAQARSGGPAV